MIVVLIILYILIALTVMTVWFIFDPFTNEDIAVMALSIIWPVTILLIILMEITDGVRILAMKIREKYVSEE